MSPDPEAEYYQTVEEFFVARRGDPLILSNAEWNLVRKWRLAGIPLRVVLRGIRDALDAHAHGWNRDRPIRSLAFCGAEVERAAERWRRALGADAGLDAAAALRGFARQLRLATGLGPRAGELALALAGELEAGAPCASLDEITAWLAPREGRLVDALAQDLGAEAAAALEAEIEAGLARWKARMPGAVIDTLRRESRARRLLEQRALPRLSLFHLEGGGGA